jgi:hypothetical protein
MLCVLVFRYLVCIMEVATPTEDCLVLIHDLLCPIIKARDENALNRQEVKWKCHHWSWVDMLLINLAVLMFYCILVLCCRNAFW